MVFFALTLVYVRFRAVVIVKNNRNATSKPAVGFEVVPIIKHPILMILVLKDRHESPVNIATKTYQQQIHLSSQWRFNDVWATKICILGTALKICNFKNKSPQVLGKYDFEFFAEYERKWLLYNIRRKFPKSNHGFFGCCFSPFLTVPSVINETILSGNPTGIPQKICMVSWIMKILFYREKM